MMKATGIIPRLSTLLITMMSLLPCKSQGIDFINTSANHIVFNGDNWTSLRHLLSNKKMWKDGKFQVVHIGDSHIQPDIVTAKIRHAMQRRWGDGGRGLLSALKLANTNGPSDYCLESTSSVRQSSRMLQSRWANEMGLTGVAVGFRDSTTSLTATLKTEDSAFDHITILHAPNGGFDTAVCNETGIKAARLSPWATRFDIQHPSHTITLDKLPCSSDFYGAVVSGPSTGVVVHTIGNNGATYSSYNKIANYGEQMKVLSPSLIIVSLGTNEAFGSTNSLDSKIDVFVSDIKRHNPDAKILLTTPMECFRKGRVNPSIATVRDIIMDYGRNHNIAVWDFYTVAGGQGSSRKWVDTGLLSSRDRIHCTDSGYELQGILLSDALIEALTR